MCPYKPVRWRKAGYDGTTAQKGRGGKSASREEASRIVELPKSAQTGHQITINAQD